MSTKSVHFIGICGAGMSGVALMMREAGWTVTGSDEGFYPPVSDLLDATGIPCLSPHAAGNIPEGVNLVVIGKHAKLTESNPEVARAFALRDQGLLRIASYPEVIRDLIESNRTVVVAGSFGKSTTTALTAWILDCAGLEPGFFVGAVPSNFSTNARLGAGRVMVIEGDEYPSANWDATSKFEYYQPEVTVITSGEHDHFNVFPTLESYLAPFERLVRLTPSTGRLVLAHGGAHLERLASLASAPVLWTGIDGNTAVSAREVTQDGPMLRFELIIKGESWGHMELPMLGRHNVENALQAIAAALEIAPVDRETLRQALSSYRGLRRRLEPKHLSSDVVIYEDLSSSRAKAMAALQAMRDAYPTHRLLAIFQPHTFSFRSRDALEWYPGMFAAADAVAVYQPPHFRTGAESSLLGHDEIFDAIQNGNSLEATSVQSLEEIGSFLDAQPRGPRAVLIMTSGGMDGLVQRIVESASTVST